MFHKEGGGVPGVVQGYTRVLGMIIRGFLTVRHRKETHPTSKRKIIGNIGVFVDLGCIILHVHRFDILFSGSFLGEPGEPRNSNSYLTVIT